VNFLFILLLSADLLKVLLLGEADLEIFLQENPLDRINTDHIKGSIQSVIKILEKVASAKDEKRVSFEHITNCTANVWGYIQFIEIIRKISIL